MNRSKQYMPVTEGLVWATLGVLLGSQLLQAGRLD